MKPKETTTRRLNSSTLQTVVSKKDELNIIIEAANIENRSVSSFLRHHVVIAAKAIINKSDDAKPSYL